MTASARLRAEGDFGKEINLANTGCINSTKSYRFRDCS
jgi:hypothetical protein